MKTILVIDGQGGRIGKLLVEQIHLAFPQEKILAIGTNSVATVAMLKAGATVGATGENPVVINAPEADVIVGPIGIVLANALLGEITPKMACAVSSCAAPKVLIPVSQCNHVVVGTEARSLGEQISLAVGQIREILDLGK